MEAKPVNQKLEHATPPVVARQPKKTTPRRQVVAGEMRTPGILRDCLANLLEEGSPRKTVNYDAFLLAKDLKRLGRTEDEAAGEILAFALKTTPPLSESEHRAIRRMVTKVYAKDDRPLSCGENHALREKGYCFLRGKDDRSCEFNNAVRETVAFLGARDMTTDNWPQWGGYLQTKFGPLGVAASAMYCVLKKVERERGIPEGQLIFLGIRELQRRLMADFPGYRPTTERLTWCGRLLEDLNIIRVQRVPEAERGTAHRKANGYIRLPLPPVPAVPVAVPPAPGNTPKLWE